MGTYPCVSLISTDLSRGRGNRLSFVSDARTLFEYLASVCLHQIDEDCYCINFRILLQVYCHFRCQQEHEAVVEEIMRTTLYYLRLKDLDYPFFLEIN